jgi:hypothetical protein
MARVSAKYFFSATVFTLQSQEEVEGVARKIDGDESAVGRRTTAFYGAPLIFDFSR